MHDIKWIRENPQAFDRGLARRGLPGEAERLIALDERRRTAIQKAEAALARRNAASRENPQAFDRGLARRGLPGEAERLIALDERRRTAIQKAEAALARRNAASR